MKADVSQKTESHLLFIEIWLNTSLPVYSNNNVGLSPFIVRKNIFELNWKSWESKVVKVETDGLGAFASRIKMVNQLWLGRTNSKKS